LFVELPEAGCQAAPANKIAIIGGCVYRIIVVLAALALSTTAIAQSGPIVPCVGCPTFTKHPYPETGAWFNPEQSGTGFSLEVQNGHMVGFYYLYDSDGKPEWLLINGTLQKSAKEGVAWELDSPLSHFSGGACLGCAFQAPAAPTEIANLHIDFLQRSSARFSVDGGTVQYIVPLVYGSSGKAAFPDKTPFIIPELAGPSMFGALRPWTLVFTDKSLPEKFSRTVLDVQIEGQLLQYGKVSYAIAQRIPPFEEITIGTLDCTTGAEFEGPVCSADFGGFPVTPPYLFSIANISDSRFFGEDENGNTVEAFRDSYD